MGVGIRLGVNNAVTSSTIADNGVGMNISAGNVIINNTMTDNARHGIILMGDYNAVINNTMTHNSVGIDASDTSNNKIEDNKLLHGETGIDIFYSLSWPPESVFNNNTISGNLIVSHTCGVRMMGPDMTTRVRSSYLQLDSIQFSIQWNCNKLRCFW